MKTQLLNKQIKFIIPLFIGTVFFLSPTYAQIVYTDVNPDSTINSNSGSYSLDLNNDGTADYSIVKSYLPHCCKSCYPWLNYSITDIFMNLFNESSVATENSLPAAFDSGTIISASGNTWSTSSGILRQRYATDCSSNGPGTYTGNWKQTKYLGLRFIVGTNIYYGWARLTVPNNANSFTIKDYAFNSDPGQSILAGQTCPTQAVITANGSTTFCESDSVILSSANTGTNLSYKWKLNGSNISGATNKSYTAKVAGKYKVIVTDNTNGCSAASALVKAKVPCRVLNNELNAGENDFLKIYPNPFSESTRINFQLTNSEKVSLKIYDLQGRLIRTLTSDVISEGEHMLTWDALDANGIAVSAGIYFLKMETATDSKIYSLSVVRQ